MNSIDPADSKYPRGTRVRKIKGSSWQGIVVGHYSSSLTPDGVNVESEREPGSVQLYPVSALEAVDTSAPLNPADVTPWIDQGTPCYHCHHSWHSHEQSVQRSPACLVNNCTCTRFQSNAEVQALDELRADKEKIRMAKAVPEPGTTEERNFYRSALTSIQAALADFPEQGLTLEGAVERINKLKQAAVERDELIEQRNEARRELGHIRTVITDKTGAAIRNDCLLAEQVGKAIVFAFGSSKSEDLRSFSTWLKNESEVSPITVDMVELLVRRWIVEFQ